MMGYSHIAELAHRRFYAEAIRSFDHRHAATFFADRGPLNADLSHYFASFELIVSYLYDPDRIFEANLKRAGARRVIVTDGKPSGNVHASVYLASWLSEVGVPPKVESPSLYPGEEDRTEARRLFPMLKQPTVVLHPGSGSPNKNWPIDRFCELAAWLREKGLRVIVMTGPADSEVDADFWKDARSAGCARCHWLELPVIAAILQQCVAFVGHDSGISHIAAAVGAPTVAIFGATNPAIWEPRGQTVKILKRGVSTEKVSCDEVKNALEDWLEKGN